MTIGELLKRAQNLLASDTRALDCELLLCHCLQKERAYLYAWPEREIDAIAEKEFQRLLDRRIAGEPIAYLIGRREFWSLPLRVNNSTLIPRPDTERLIEIAIDLPLPENANILDLGTGSGAIALALASEKPGWRILGVDVAQDAVQLAEQNAAELRISNVLFLQSNWFEKIRPQQFDLIVSNPPYIAEDDPHLLQGDVRFEPRRALVAAQQGLAAITEIATTAKSFLRKGAWLLFEHGCDQAPAVRTLLSQLDYDDISTWSDWGGNERVTGGRAQ
ncbi:MAG TPA: peptide chain release factor N(5)-glutamine methyltransferase [Spongiibacteraceae bacterium]|nr:peptide chain release factor N(5)-glutamine methyltransferase [Spongiibacteraceae bacterium]